MTPFEWFVLGVVASVVAVGVVAGLAWLVTSGPLSPPTIIEEFDVSATHVCAVDSCNQLVRYSLSNGKSGTEVTVRSFKDGVELSYSPAHGQTGSPFTWEESFSGTDRRLFDGPGAHELRLSLTGNLGGIRRNLPTEATATFVALDDGENLVPMRFRAPAGMVDASQRREIPARGNIDPSRTTGPRLGVLADEPSLRINCKDTLLKGFVLRTVDVGLPLTNLDAIRGAGILGDAEDEDAVHPVDVSATLTLADGTQFDLGQLDTLGQVFTLPAPVELTQRVDVVVIRASGPTPFFPSRPVITELDAIIGCVSS